MPEPKVAPEVAAEDFQRMCVARRIDLDESDWDDDDRKAFAALKKLIVKAISAGSLAVNDEGDPTYTAPSGASFKFKKATGATLIAMDGKTGTAKVFAALADMSGKATTHFGQLEVADLNLLANLFTLFFQR
jgi:hypothetical protein